MKGNAPHGHWPRWVLLVPLILAGMVLFRVFLPQAKAILPACNLYTAMEIYCPGCGGTRAAEALMHFRVGEAMRQNAWAVLALLLGIPFVGLAALRVRFPGIFVFGLFRWRPWMVWFLVATIGLFFILRNTPAFDWLAPVTCP